MNAFLNKKILLFTIFLLIIDKFCFRINLPMMNEVLL